MRIDDFESVFRSAVKTRFHFERFDLERVLLITDMDRAASEPLGELVQRFLKHLEAEDQFELEILSREDWESVPALLEMVRARQPGLVVSYRLLLNDDKDLPRTMGTVLDGLVQVTEYPVLVLPRPDHPSLDELLAGTTRVLVITDHMTGDDKLVNWGVHFTPDFGTLVLAHVEDDQVFEHYMEVISRLQGIPTDDAREGILEKLMEMPRDYIHSVSQELMGSGVQETVVPVVEMGNPLEAYEEIARRRGVQLIITNSRDPSRRAMAALSHAIAVEIRDVPLLLL